MAHFGKCLFLFPVLPLLLGGCMAETTPTPAEYDFGAQPPGTGSTSPTGVSPRPPSDRYRDGETNPFVMAAYDPRSTFAADVDTASYDIMLREVLEYSTLPDPRSVRLEEYVNAFDYADPAPAEEDPVPFRVTLQAAPHPLGRNLAMLRVGIQARERSPFVKLPAHLVFLVDVSGSMGAEDKLPLVKVLIAASLDSLERDDLVSIVTYAGETRVALEPTAVAERDRILSVLDELEADGGTDGGQGIQLAYAQAMAGYRSGGINHVVLCTDGDFNIGISDPNELVALIEEKRESGVTLTALGFGRGNLNDAMMERVSNAGNGIYSVITTVERAERYAREELLRTAEHVAKDVKIQVEFNPAHVLAYRLLGYENRALADEDFRRDAVDAGEIGAGHHVMALYEIVLPGQEVPRPEGAPAPLDGEPAGGDTEVDTEDLVLVKVRFKRPRASAEDPAQEVSASLRPGQIAASIQEADEDLRWASAVAAFAEILKQSPYARLEEDLESIERIAGSQAGRSPRHAEFLQVTQAARRLLGRPTP